MRNQQIEPMSFIDKGRGLTIYLDKEVVRLKKYSAEEEASLAQKIKSGDKQAEHELVQSNLLFVAFIAKKYKNKGVELPDLIEEGNLRMLKIVKEFDSTKGFKFITFAARQLHWAMQSAIHEYSDVRTQSIYKPIVEDLTVGDITPDTSFTPPDHDIIWESFNDDVWFTIKAIFPGEGNERMRKILELSLGRYGTEPQSTSVISDYLNKNKSGPDEKDIGPERVRQLRDQGLAKIQGNKKAQLLKEYFSYM